MTGREREEEGREKRWRTVSLKMEREGERELSSFVFLMNNVISKELTVCLLDFFSYSSKTIESMSNDGNCFARKQKRAYRVIEECC